MGLADIANIPRTTEERAQWAFSHMAHHRDINRVIQDQTGVRLDEYILDPMQPENIDIWVYQHQIMHNNQNAILGISGNDLTDVNWDDPGQMTVWIGLNMTEHLQANQILGV